MADRPWLLGRFYETGAIKINLFCYFAAQGTKPSTVQICMKRVVAHNTPGVVAADCVSWMGD
jgi:hypothetical protein